ncbi:YfhO family protein [Clostridium oryzae]|uniref:Bacterial membrane protein YfhO n=1 Tax=Clostridium oryzae TaxID=1450648 RepID=A0A1V4IJY0_9CLOT|nr:YfhO family protein [Clostridium oryzae]OPJ60328.1 bacterial membrane protein YfhO [Clostridium oryzae]
MTNRKAIKNSNTSYILIFTCLFTIVSCIVFMPFMIENKSFIWISDGTDQHYTSLIYYSHYLRSIIKHLLTTGKLSFPMWDFKIGQGSDIITTLHYYCLGDPLALLVVLFPEKYMTNCYDFLVILRLYLSGLAFSAYCFYQKKDKTAAFAGAFVYMFCGFSLTYIKHPFFLNPLIYMPILFIGVEKILKKQSPSLFIMMIFLSAVSNFYFFFILTILTFIYAVIRCFCIEDISRNIKYLVQVMGKGIISYILGTAMAAFILVPIAMVMKQTSRYAESGTGVFLFYPLEYFRRLFLSFTYIASENYWDHADAVKNTITKDSYWSCLGFAATAVLVIILLFVSKNKKLKSVKFGFLAGLCFICIPAAGYVFNGFAYVSNRWIFGFAFVIAFSFTLVIPSLKKGISNFVWLGSALWVAAIFAVNTISIIMGYHKDFIGISISAGFIAILFIVERCRKYIKNDIFVYTFVMLTIISICINGNLFYNKHFGNIINEYSYRDEYRNNLRNSSLKAIKHIKDSTFFRTDTYRYTYDNAGELKELSSNESMLLGYKGLASYFSLINSNYSNYIQQLDIIGVLSPHRIYNLDNRTVLNELASVKYSIEMKEKKGDVPYGYKFIKNINSKREKAKLYKNRYALPLGYGYSTSMDTKDFEKLNPIDKQQAMLSNVILTENTDISGIEKGNYTSETVDVRYRKSSEKTIKPEYEKHYGENEYTMKPFSNSETYLLLKNVRFSGASRVNVIAQTKNIIKFAKFYDKSEIYYYGRKDAVINLGYYKKGISNFVVYTDAKGKLSYDKMEVISVPMNSYAGKVKELKENSMRNIKVSGSRITGKVNLKSNKLLCLAVPYSSGWKAKVDGKSARIYKANIMYMAIPIQLGKHQIELDYCTPGLLPGSFISLIAFFVFIGAVIINACASLSVFKHSRIYRV